MRIIMNDSTDQDYSLNGAPVTMGPRGYSDWFYVVYMRNRLRQKNTKRPNRFHVRRVVRHARVHKQIPAHI
jgi:hypothetical protein